FFNPVDVHRLKRAQANVESDLCGLYSVILKAREDFRSEMESGGGGGDGSALAGVDRLVAIAVAGLGCAGDVRGQRHTAQTFQRGEEIGDGCKAQNAFSKLSAAQDFGLKLGWLAEEQVFPDSDLAARADETLPIVGGLAELPREQDFVATLKK